MLFYFIEFELKFWNNSDYIFKSSVGEVIFHS